MDVHRYAGSFASRVILDLISCRTGGSCGLVKNSSIHRGLDLSSTGFDVRSSISQAVGSIGSDKSERYLRWMNLSLTLVRS